MDKQFPEQQLDFLILCGQLRFTLNCAIKYPHHIHLYKQTVALWDALINEEVNTELRRHLMDYILSPIYPVNKEEKLHQLSLIADDIADSIYVLCGLANAMGIPLTRVWNAIHSANLDKAPNGVITKRADGKILKPEGWKPADVRGIIEETL